MTDCVQLGLRPRGPEEQHPIAGLVHRLLRPGRERRGEESHCASDKGAPIHHSITWSARESTDCGIVRPSAFAVLRLITSSNLVGCSTGRSAGFAPFEGFLAKNPPRRDKAIKIPPHIQN